MRQKSAFFVFWSLFSGCLLSAAGIELANVTVGSSLQTSATFKLSEPAPEGGLQVTIKSENPSLVKLARRPDAAGTESIVVHVQGGFNESPDFWLQGFASKGEVAFTATAPGLTPGRAVVTLTPSSIAMVGPFKASSFKTTTGGLPSRIVLHAARLTPEMEFAEQQAVAGGADLEVEIINSAREVGTVEPAKVTIPAGAPNATVDFKPAKPGSTTLSIKPPAGFSPPPAKYANVVANVALPGIALTDQVMIGQNLQIGANVGLGEFAGPNGVQVTITSEDETKLLISKSATEVGAKTAVITIKPNGVSSPFYLQALGKSGTVSYTATAKGFASRAAKVGLAPSGVVIAPKPYGPPDEAELFKKGQEGARGFVMHLKKKDTMGLAIWTAQLDPVTLRSADITVQPLRAGMTITVNVESSNPAVGKVDTGIVISGGSEIGSTEFTPLSLGTTMVTAITPAGFTKSANSTSVEAIVKE
jgi:hypothetical protein